MTEATLPPIGAVHQVIEIEVELDKLILRVSAKGTTRTTRWTKPSLVLIDMNGSSESELHLVFTALRPEGISEDKVSGIDTTFVFEYTGTAPTRVVVHSETNSKIVTVAR